MAATGAGDDIGTRQHDRQHRRRRGRILRNHSRIPRPQDLSLNPSAISPAEAASPGGGPERPVPFRTGLGVLLAVALLQQLWILWDAWAGNPLTRNPLADAEVYWQWAGDISRGHWTRGQEPFFSAPLYPYFLGLWRSLGFGLLGVFVVQVVLHLANTTLLACLTRRRFGPGPALVAAGLFVFLTESAFFPGRILNPTLQWTLLLGLWWTWLEAKEKGGWKAEAGLGLMLGLNCLVNPPMQLALAAALVWALVHFGRNRQGFLATARIGGVAILAILPATWHNWSTCGEFIPISAQAGLTFHHGNAPGAVGFYQAAEGVSSDRRKQNQDARRVAVAATGEESWKATDRYFRNKGLAFWADHPGDAIGLTLRKAALFFFAQRYGDIYVPTLERNEGWLRPLWLAPLPVAWIALPALVYWLSQIRKRKELWLEALLLVVPFLVVSLFWFSPRYRAPAVPLLAALAGAALWQCRHLPRQKTPGLAFAGSFVAAAFLSWVLTGPLKDQLSLMKPAFQVTLAQAFSAEGNHAKAIEHYRAAAALDPSNATVRSQLAEAMRRGGFQDDAVKEAEQAVANNPEDPFLRKSLGTVYLSADRTEDAILEFKKAVDLGMVEAELYANLGAAYMRLPEPDWQATLHWTEKALATDPRFAPAAFNRGIAFLQGQQPDQARDAFLLALQWDPALSKAAYYVFPLLPPLEGLERLRQSLRLNPSDLQVADFLAWLLATSEDAALRNGEEAVALAEEVNRQSGFENPSYLDTLAAALAESGDFDQALHYQDKAIELAKQLGWDGEIPSYQARRTQYREQRPFRESRP